MRLDTPAEQFFFTTVYIEGFEDPNSDTADWTGTGFVVECKTPNGTFPVTVTNKHVLKGARKILVRCVKANGDGTPFPGATQTYLHNFSENFWIGHPDDGVDVAVFPFSPIYQQMVEEHRPPLHRRFPMDSMLTAETASALDAIEDVLFIGYPDGLFDSYNFLPIARRGQTATPINVDYQNKPAFLIDATIFPGSSGSPVILFNSGMYHDRNGSTIVGSRFALIGILAAMHVTTTYGNIVDVPTGKYAEITQGLNLGIVYKASTIYECIEILAGRLGIVLAEETKPQSPA